jgi:hypothetical protein
MGSWKFLTCFVVLISIFCIFEVSSKSKDEYLEGLRFKSAKCESDNTTISIKYCYLKAISRRIVSFNLGLIFLIPYTKPYYVQMILSYRYGTIFRTVIDTKRVEWCGFMTGSNVHPYFKLSVDQLRKSASILFHKCPYDGEIDLKNVTVNELYNSGPFNFPEGIYRSDIIIFRNDKQTLKVTNVCEVKSSLKETFG